MKIDKRNPYLINRTFKTYFIAAMLSSMALSLGVVVDGVIVGNLLGPDALSAVNLAAPVMQLFTAIYQLINVGGVILSAMAIGKQKFDEVHRIFSLSMAFNVTVGFLSVFAGLFFLDDIVRLLCSSIELQPLVKEYVGIVLWSSPVYIILPGLCEYLCADSNPKLASVALIVANVVNLGLDVLFISVFSLGVFSAALATGIGFLVGLCIASTHFLKKERILHIVKPAFKQKTARLLLTGLPLAMASILLTIRLLSVNNIILYSLGAAGISILSVCFNLLMIATMFVGGTVQTIQPIAGVLYGSEDFKGVRMAVRTAVKTMTVCLMLFLILLSIAPGFLSSLFGLSGTALIVQARPAIRLFALSIPLFGLNYLLMAIFQLGGRNKFSILVSCLQALMVIPVMLLATLSNHEALIWLSFALGELLVLGMIVVASQKVRRKQPRLSFVTLIDAPQQDGSFLDFSLLSEPDNIGALNDTVHQFLLEKTVDKRCANAVAVCAEELTLNIMQHAYVKGNKHYVDIRLRLLPDKALLCITDDGIPFDPVKYDPSGIGLLLVRKLCSHIQYSRTLHQNVVIVEVKTKEIG